jgi:hypothetical protein
MVKVGQINNTLSQNKIIYFRTKRVKKLIENLNNTLVQKKIKIT